MKALYRIVIYNAGILKPEAIIRTETRKFKAADDAIIYAYDLMKELNAKDFSVLRIN
jgi:hypothetical protein